MDNTNLTILIPASVGLMMLIFFAYFYMARTTSAAAKKVKGRLSTIKRRHSDKPSTAIERSIRINKAETGFGAQLAEYLPRREAIRERLFKAGFETTLSKYALFCAGISGCATLLNLAMGWPFAIALMFGVATGIGVPHWFVGFSGKRRIAKFTKQFPDAIDLMVRGLKSGLPVNETIANVAAEMAAPTGTEFKKIVDSMRLGKTLEESLWDTAKRLDTPDFKFFVTSLAVQRETGGNLAETLGNLSTILRARQQMKLKVKALSSEAKASAWIVGCLPFIMLGLIMVVNYDYGIVLFTHPQAIIAGIMGLFWMGIGVFIMSRMISFEV